MYPISNDLLAIFQSGGMQYARLTIGNSTIGNDRIKQGSFSINRYVETNESVAIGSVVAAELVFVLDNYDGAYDNTDFVGTEAYVEIGVKDSNNTVQYVPMGYFTFDEATRTKNTISLAALDRMTKFDIPVNASDLSFPYTLTNLLSRICTLCSVTKGSFGTITNSSYSVASLPSEAKTYRDLLRWICELSGSNAYISYDGKLYLGWYGTTSQFNILPSNRTSSDIDKNTFTITGVTILTGDNQKYTAGTNVRPITINNNPFITTTQAQSVANTLNTKLGGFSYCPFTAVMLPSPMIYPMDRATFTTAEGTTVAVSVTEVTYKLNGNTSIGCKGEMQVRGRSYGLADQTFYASNIAAGAVTADKISVTDLNALHATIAGWNIGTDKISKTVDGKVAEISSATPKVLMSSENHYAEVNGNAEITTYYGGGQWADVSQGETVMKGQEISQDYDVWEVHATYADWVRKSESSLTDATLTLKGREIDPDTQYLEDNFHTAVLDERDLTFDGHSLKRLTPHLAQMWSTQIPANANLNTTTYVAAGQYFCFSDANAESLSNCPTTLSFTMTVSVPTRTTYNDDTSGAYVSRIREITTWKGDKYVQSCYTQGTAGSYTFGAWQKVITTSRDALVYIDELSSRNLVDVALVQQGSLSGQGAETSGTTRIRSNYVPVGGNRTYYIATNSTLLIYEIHEYSSASASSFIKYTSVNATSKIIKVSSSTRYIRVLMRKSDNSVVTADDGTFLQVNESTVAISYYPYLPWSPINTPTYDFNALTVSAGNDNVNFYTEWLKRVAKNATYYAARPIQGRIVPSSQGAVFGHIYNDIRNGLPYDSGFIWVHNRGIKYFGTYNGVVSVKNVLTDGDTPTTGTATKNTTYIGATGSVKWTKHGRTVHLQGSFYAKSAMYSAGGRNLFTGVPAAYSSCECLAIPVGDSSYYNSNIIPLVIDSSGNVIANFSGTRLFDEEVPFIIDTTYIS